MKKCIWTPFAKQKLALERSEYEILFGGARGPGKTEAGINWLLYDVDNPKLRALIIRRNADDLRDWTDRANQIYSQLGAIRAGNPPEFKWPSGAIFRTGHLKDDQAYTKYQGHEYQRMVIEELNQIPSEENYLRLLASCRTTVKGLRSQVFLTTNPGGVGHMWVKNRFVDPAPPLTSFEDKTSGRTRIFIKATLDDNPILNEIDPDYIKSLDALKDTNPELYRAWRHGDWDVFSGQVFAEFRRDKHVMERVLPNSDLSHFLWTDWGYSERSAFASYASALIKMKNEDGDSFHRVVTYREWYGHLKTPREWARLIYEKSRKYKRWIIDGEMVNPRADKSEPLVKQFTKEWKNLHGRNWITSIVPGTKKRIQKIATVHNWLSMAPDGLPYWVITENCINLIKTLPMLIYDEHARSGKNREDIDQTQTDGKTTIDHGFDACSYGLGHIKFITTPLGAIGKKPAKTKFKVHKELIGTDSRPLDLDAFRIKEVREKDWKSI